MAAFAKTSSSCNSTLEKCQHSLKSSFKKVKSQIQKGANPEKAARRGYEEACEYLIWNLEIWNKTILIEQRALACLSKSLAHVLQRELYTMGNTSLLRPEAEMTLLQPQLVDTRRQELRNLRFWPSSLFNSQLVKEGEDFLLKKGTSKDAQGFAPCQNKPFHGSHNKKRGSVSPQGALEISSVVRQPPSLDRNHFSTPRLVAESHKRDERHRPSSQGPQYPTLYRHLKRRLGRSLTANLHKGSVVRQGKRLHINFLELKVVSLTLQRFNDQFQNQTVLVATDNSTAVAYINKQLRRNPLGGDVCSPVENYDLVPSLQDNIKSQTHSKVS